MTGIELINQERNEQIEKHGFTPISDTEYTNGQLLNAAQFCLTPKNHNSDWSQGWKTFFKYKILENTRVEQLTKACAFYMAENQRRGDLKYQPEINKIASEIDDLLSDELEDSEADFDNDEILGYQCSACGNIQDQNTGFGCDTCTGKCLEPWFG